MHKSFLRYLSGQEDYAFGYEDLCNLFYAQSLASLLGVGIHTIYYWRDKGVIQAFQETGRSPWWYVVTPEVLDTLRKKIRRVPVKYK